MGASKTWSVRHFSTHCVPLRVIAGKRRRHWESTALRFEENYANPKTNLQSEIQWTVVGAIGRVQDSAPLILVCEHFPGGSATL